MSENEMLKIAERIVELELICHNSTDDAEIEQAQNEINDIAFSDNMDLDTLLSISELVEEMLENYF